ncbi:porin [Rhizobium deserti]|uniref:Porin n=1 Tax=Rhizobium deserti TaxID=2547961 RepID=A0A4R5UK80_9HYPH|nr:porin [Rhizobium deserti]TDK37183.1 porin [Rhizobium deserti]
MNIKSLLLGSAAALAAVSGAQAADAIVAAEPEPMEYVRVCDAFGKGYFYIPGTETCLKIGGYVRFQVDFDDVDDVVAGAGGAVIDIDDDNWNARTRALINVSAKSDTEYGALSSYIALRSWAEGDYVGDGEGELNELEIDEAYITLGGFKVGYAYNYWDIGLSGETDDLGSNRINQIGYEYTSETIKAGIFVDELTGHYTENDFGAALGTTDGYGNDGVGIEAMVSGAFGPISASLLGGYDFAAEDGSIRGIVSGKIGTGTLSVAGIYSTGANAYYDLAEWTVAAEYAVKLGDKFTITPAFQYWDSLDADLSGDFGGDRNAWRAGVTLDYKIVEGLTSKVSLQYTDMDDDGDISDDEEVFSGFVRLQRTF